MPDAALSVEPSSLARLVVHVLQEAVAALGEARDAINSINVFPVADADTGTNMWLTLRAAFDSAEEALQATRGHADQSVKLERVTSESDRVDLAVLSAAASGALEAARGNSGAILAAYLGGFASVLSAAAEAQQRIRIDSALLAHCLTAAADAARLAVASPARGTILTVAESVASAAQIGAGESRNEIGYIAQAAVDAARDAVTATTDQLDVLRRAAVVDAGAVGLWVVLAACVRACGGRATADPASLGLPRHTDAGSDDTGALYEVVLRAFPQDSGADARTLTQWLVSHGESIVVNSCGPKDPRYRVHIHTSDVSGVLDLCKGWGADHALVHALGRQRSTPWAIVALTATPGLLSPLANAGAVGVWVGDGVLRSQVLARAVQDAQAPVVVLLAGDLPGVAADELSAVARRAALRTGVRVEVVCDPEPGSDARLVAAVLSGLQVEEPRQTRGVEPASLAWTNEVAATMRSTFHATRDVTVDLADGVARSVATFPDASAVSPGSPAVMLLGRDVSPARASALLDALESLGWDVQEVPGVYSGARVSLGFEMPQSVAAPSTVTSPRVRR